ncbi:hypothetical protein PLICRDRAFT_487384 [Plicaturopsis crispa FD-325 SS-3]|nr:hypothetical protein PLICRDRAFT_487384 [Plicaturopsis crispa FD-325 SS-3]
MVSTTAPVASGSRAPATEESRPQAGPLPTKQGEIGFQEGVHGQEASADDASAIAPMPARHPADRDAIGPESITVPPPAVLSSTPSTVPDPSLSAAPASAPVAETSASSTHSTGKRSIISFLRPKRIPSCGGIRLPTLISFVLQLIVIGATIAGWALTAMVLAANARKDQANNTIQGSFGASSSSIFRRVFRIRAERYGHLHPGQMLPSHHRRSSQSSDTGMGFAPWHRPPIPTYAAALAQSGHGTGDVEDHLIAAPPPPAYGHTRGSTLILAGFLNENLRAQRPPSEHSVRSTREETGERPISYMSRDEEWEEICDAERARALESTLSQLADGSFVGVNHQPVQSRR